VELKAPSSKNEFGCLKHDEINQMKAGDAQTISTALFAQSETLSIRMHSLVEQLYGTNDYLVKILEKNETPRARMIVKQEYLDEYGWEPPQPNPINQMLDVTGTQFVDDFSNEDGDVPGLYWVGILDQNQNIISCIRYETKLTEIESYFPKIKEIYPNGFIESNRLAVDASQKKLGKYTHIFLLPAITHLNFSEEMNRPCLVTLSNRRLQSIAEYFGYKAVGEFKYYPTDKYPAVVYEVSISTMDQLNFTGGFDQKLLRKTMKKYNVFKNYSETEYKESWKSKL
jgi:hypothetical protein